MEPYNIKHQHQDPANHSQHSFANCYRLHKRYKHSTNMTKPRSFQWTPISNFIILKQLTQIHPLLVLNAYLDPPRNRKATIFHNNEHTNIIISDPNITFEKCIKTSHIHTTIILQYLSSRKNKLLTPYLSYNILTFIYQNKHYTSYAYKSDTAQSQQITTCANLITYSKS